MTNSFSDLKRETLRTYLRALIAGGYVIKATEGDVKTPTIFKLAKDVGVNAPNVNSKGELSGAFAFGGENEQAKRLMEDGVEVVEGKVDLEKYGI